jgi:hypothetical protein
MSKGDRLARRDRLPDCKNKVRRSAQEESVQEQKGNVIKKKGNARVVLQRFGQSVVDDLSAKGKKRDVETVIE